jgi:hypothetical protein
MHKEQTLFSALRKMLLHQRFFEAGIGRNQAYDVIFNFYALY